MHAKDQGLIDHLEWHHTHTPGQWAAVVAAAAAGRGGGVLAVCVQPVQLGAEPAGGARPPMCNKDNQGVALWLKSVLQSKMRQQQQQQQQQ